MRVSTTHRRDAIPEHLDYRDDGCDLHSACLSCPLPRCRYDEPNGIQTRHRRERQREMRLLAEQDVPVDELAERFAVSRRTVFRALAGQAP